LKHILELKIPFNNDEIKQASFDSNGNKAPSPDDISFHFYQTYWDIIKEDIFY
jgi:hypothetical protein